MNRVSGEIDLQGPPVDRSGRYHLNQYLTSLHKAPPLDRKRHNERVVSRARDIYICRRKMSEEIATLPTVVHVLIDTHNRHQKRNLKVGNYALSVGDQSVESMDLCYEANRSRGPKDDVVQSVDTQPAHLVAALDELGAHFNDFASTRRKHANRAKAYSRCQSLFLRLELRWPTYRDLLSSYTSATDSLIEAAVRLLAAIEPDRDEALLKKDLLCQTSASSTDALLNSICPNQDLEVLQQDTRYQHRRATLDAIEAALSVTLPSVVASRWRYDRANARRAALVGEIAQLNLLLVAQRVRSLSISDPDDIFDAIQEGNQGLMEAAERYKYWLGNRFSTVGVRWINHYLGKCRKSQLQVYEIPVSVENLNFRIARARKELQARGNQDPSHTELARHLGVPLNRVQNAQAVFIPAEREEESLNAIPDDRLSCSVDQIAETDERDQVIRAAVDTLPETHRQVCSQRFGLGGGPTRTLEDISDTLGLSKERIRLIEKEALVKLLRGPHAAALKSLVAVPASHASY